MKITRLFNTLRYLKPVQVLYQVKYRLLKPKPLSGYVKKERDFSIQPLNFFPLPDREPVLRLQNNGYTFRFLNLEKTFESTVDWSEQSYGKLWNYNLQYLDFLRQQDIPVAVKAKHLLDLYGWLDTGKIPLEPYPASLRIMNVIRFLQHSGITDPKINQYLHAEAEFLAGRLEYHLLGNHLLENAFALLMAGHFFGDNKLVQKAEKLLYRQLPEQMLEDGAHFELSPMYHQIILFRVLEALAYLPEESDLAAQCREKGVKMLGWSRNMVFANGNFPHFNDSTDGIAFSYRELEEQSLTVGLPKGQPMPGLGASGYRKFEVGAYECVVDLADIGPTYQPGHGHADALSFILHHQGMPLLVEAGTSTYSEESQRDAERGTYSHNTVTVNGMNQSEVYGAFRVGRRAKVTTQEEGKTFLQAYHDGYMKPLNISHHRHFFFSTHNLTIKDCLIGSDPNQAEASFHFHPAVPVNIIDNTLCIEEVGRLQFEGATKIKIEDYRFAEGFNKTVSAKVVRVNFAKDLQTTFVFQR